MGPRRRSVRHVDWPLPIHGQERKGTLQPHSNGPIPAPGPNEFRCETADHENAFAGPGQETVRIGSLGRPLGVQWNTSSCLIYCPSSEKGSQLKLTMTDQSPVASSHKSDYIFLFNFLI